MRSTSSRLVPLGAAVLAACLAGSAAAVEPPTGELRPCKELALPDHPPERVTCTTPNATLVIAHQSDPVLLAGTEVRVLSGTLDGSTVAVRLRVRNKTKAEQGLSAGGQELYLHLDGERIDTQPVGDVRLPIDFAESFELQFVLAPHQLETLSANGGRIDFGVRPWHDQVGPPPAIGVIRVRVGG